MFQELERKNLKSSKIISPFEIKKLYPTWLVKENLEAFWIVSALSLFLTAQLSTFDSYLSFSLLYCVFLCIRFGQIKLIGIWLAISGLLWGSLTYQTSLKAQEGIYEVINIRSGYTLAKLGTTKVIIYETDFDLGDHLMLSNFQTVHSTNNPGLFCFQQFLNQTGIYQSAKEFKRLDSYTSSWRRTIWLGIKHSKAAPLYQWLFYGLTSIETPFSALGFPMMALMSVCRKIFERYFLTRTVNILVLFEQGLFLILFPIQDTSLRLFVFELGCCFFSSWNKRWPFQIILFILLNPYAARSMGLILPAGLSFLTHYQSTPLGKKAIQLFWCAFCQIALMGELNLILLGGFLWLRTLFGWAVIFTLPGLWIDSYGLFVWESLQKLSSWKWITITTYPPFWYLIFAFLGIVWMTWKYQTKAMIMTLGLLCLYPFIWKLDPFFHLYQLDVGQGEAAILVEPFQRSVIMIDAAGRFNHDQASELYLPFFQSRQIYALDALIVSHGDFDHSGAVDSLLTKMPVQSYITTYEDKIPCSYAFELLLKERSFQNEEDENDKSLICAFQYDGFQYLWTGDASIEIEKQLLEHYSVKADILKLGHHGSNTSSDAHFLRAVNPRLALISSGYQNRYNHPSLEVLVNLNKLGIDRLNTADHGYIHLFSWPHFLGVQTADGLFTCLFKA